jgi:hypothetical protein
MSTQLQSHPWSKDALFSKALFLSQKMDESIHDEWQYGLFSALSLELLIRSSLANISPVLLADAKDWTNISFALTSSFDKTNARSIGIQDVLNRVKVLIPDFTNENVNFCLIHIERRNAELHSGEIAFSKNSRSEWLPKYYKACSILLKSLNKSLNDFVKNAEKAQELIDSLDESSVKSVMMSIQAYQKVWSDKSSDEKSAAQARADTWATRDQGHRVKCPACNSTALVKGTNIGTPSDLIEEDLITQRQTMTPSSFECVACGLKISGFSKLVACGLGDTFTQTSTYTAAEFFSLYTEDDLDSAREEGRQERHLYEDDFNE